VDAIRGLAVPEQVQQALTGVVRGLQAAAGENLACVVLYGGAARGTYVEGRSDLDLAIVLHDAGAVKLRAIADVLSQGWRAARVEPYLLRSDELVGAADAFAVRFADIARHRIILHGEDVFARLSIPKRALRLRLEMEARNLLLRHRRGMVLGSEDAWESLRRLRGDVTPILHVLAAMLDFAGEVAPPADAPALVRAASERFRLDRAVLDELLEMRDPAAPVTDPLAVSARTLGLLESMATVISIWEDSTP